MNLSLRAFRRCDEMRPADTIAEAVALRPVQDRPAPRSWKEWVNMSRKIAGLVMVAVGATFMAVTFANHLFTVGPAFDRMSADFRPVMKSQAVAVYRNDLNGLSAAVAELQTKALPAIAAQLGTTPQAFSSFLSEQFPAVATGLKVVPAATQQFGGVLTTLNNEAARFAAADQIPTSWLPAATVPWALFGLGILVVIGGIATFLTRGRGVNFALALILIVLAFAIGLPGKAASSDTMNDHLAPVYTQQMITAASSSLGALQAMGAEMQTKMLPALAQSLHMTQPQLQTFLQTNYPAVAAGLAGMPAALTRFSSLVGTFAGRLGDYQTLQPVSFVPIVWVMIIGLAIVVVAAAALTGTRGYVVPMPASRAKAA
jgi:hypothetical protein